MNNDKIFEDYFSELQADMVSIALEYANEKADYIYIYGSNENGMLFFNVFYKINNKVLDKSELDNIDKTYDVSRERQSMLMQIGLDDLEKITSLCKEYNREMPTEMKMIYHVATGAFDAQYQHELLHSDTEDLTAMDIFEQWFEEVSNNPLSTNE